MKNNETSYPRNKIKILLLENISKSAVAEFEDAGYIEIKQLSGALSEAELCEAIKAFTFWAFVPKRKLLKKLSKTLINC